MKKFLSLILACLFVFSSCASTKKQTQRPVDSVVMLSALKITGKNYIASGFAISKRRILTVAHFCLGVHEAQIRNEAKEVEIRILSSDNVVLGGLGSIEAMDEQKDLCIINTGWAHGLPVLKITNPDEYVSPMEQIEIIGAPASTFPSQNAGHVVRYSKVNVEGIERKRIILNVVGTYGSSGGPVIDIENRVVGVVMGKVGAYDHTIFAVTIQDVWEFLVDEYSNKGE